MHRVTRRPLSLIALLAVAAGALLAASDSAIAEPDELKPVRVDEIAPGIGGEPEGQRTGPGNEQPTVATVYHDGVPHHLLVYMSSNVAEEERPWQCKCTSLSLGAGGPTVVADQVQITHGISDGARRPCNHPALASFAFGPAPDASGYQASIAVLTYGSDVDNPNNRVETRAVALNHRCELVSDTVRISEDPNVNQGAPDIDYNGGGVFTSGYLDNGQITRAVGLKVSVSGGAATIERTFDTPVVEPANIGRPTLVSVSADRSVLCAAKGDNRPPEDGVECALLDMGTGEILHKEVVAASDPDNDRYMNQPELALLRAATTDRPALLALLYQQSSGPPRDPDGNKLGKGENRSDVIAFSAGSQGFDARRDAGAALPLLDSHAGLCGGASPDPARPFAAVLSGPITGIGKTYYYELPYDEAAGAFRAARQVELAPWGDAGFLANRNGENPGVQGREFYRCLIAGNPLYGRSFMPSARALVLAPYTGHVDGEEKNRLSYSVIPALIGGPEGLSGAEGGLSTAEGGCAVGFARRGGGAPSWGWAALLALAAAFAARARRGGAR